MALSRFLRLAPRRHLCSSTVASAGVATPSPPQPPTIPNSNPKTVTASIDALYKERDLDRFLSRFKYHSATSPLFRSKHGIYEVAVRRLVEARRLDDVTEILESHKSHASEFAGYEGFAAGIISLYGKAGMADKAYETFRELPDLGCPRTVRSFNALLSSLGDPDRVVGEFQVIPLENPEIVPDVFSYSTVIRALLEKGDLDGAMGILDAMDEKGVLPNVVTFNTILNGLYKHDRFDEAEKIWAKMGEKSCDPDVRTFNAKLRWLVSKGKTSEAVELFQELEGRGLKPDGYSITSLIMGHCKHGDLKEAKKMFDELRKRGCEPNPWTYEALVPRVLEAGEIDLAISMCNECMKKKCFMAVEVLQAVVDGLAEASRLEDAKKLVESGWSRHYSRESLIMPDPCLALELEKEGKTVEVNEQGRKESEGSLVLKEFDDDMAGTQEEDPSKGLYAKIGIIVKSFEKPQYFGAFGVPPDKNRVKLPSTRTLITVLRSPHIDKKSREQFEMKVRREYITIKCRPHELHKKYFWFQRTRILGAQFELVFSYKTRLDMSRLKKSV